jgi:hypothetical protein
MNSTTTQLHKLIAGKEIELRLKKKQEEIMRDILSMKAEFDDLKLRIDNLRKELV